MKQKKSAAMLLACFLLFCPSGTAQAAEKENGAESSRQYIKWVDFDVTAEAMKDAMNADIESGGSICWTELLAALGVKYGGNFASYKRADLKGYIEAFHSGKSFAELTANEKLYRYYSEAYSAVLGGMLGAYTEIAADGTKTEGYGLTAYSPIAKGYSFNHYDDFGASRSYGYRRRHLGHDLMGNIGTPVIAVEAGYVEACGWNQYGGWRLGIRSFDGKRYYYYAHLRKNHPYTDMYAGKIIDAGEVIGYLGMTGYSAKENTNNINVPHLHYGLQLIFDPSQKDGWNQIWIDMYELTKFLSINKSAVFKGEDGEYHASAVRVPRESRD